MKTILQYTLALGLVLIMHAGAVYAGNPVINSVSANATQIGQYEKFELTVTLTATYNSPWDFDQVNLKCQFTSPSGYTYNVDGFYYQGYTMTQPDVLVTSGGPLWKIRFSPNETGTWYYTVSLVDTQGSTTWQQQQFVCVSTQRKGFVRRDGNRFRYDNGQTFTGIGTNLAWRWWEAGFTAYGDWIDEMGDQGANFTKITLAPWGFDFEWKNTGAGSYLQRQNRAWALDWVFDKLTENHVYCEFNFMVHDVLTGNNYGWQDNPYNEINGGPSNEPQNFLVNETSRHLYKRKMRYILARWGYSPYLFSWEILSEADNTGIYSNFYNQTFSWLTEMGSYIKSIDPYHRAVSSGFAIPQRDPQYWSFNGTDYTQLHIYDLIPDLDMKLYNFARSYGAAYNKPFVVGEFALAHTPDIIQQKDPAGIAFHNSLWATAFSGSFATAMSWWWDSYLYPNGLFDDFKPISDFFEITGVNPHDFNADMALTTCNTSGQLVVEPDYNNPGSKAPENYFEVHPSGYQSPTGLKLGEILHGSVSGSNKNPPTFHVNYTKDGTFSVKTGDVVLLANIRVKLDGVTVINQSAGAGHTYTMNVPAGVHEIYVQNTGFGVMEVDHYIFGNYMPNLRTFIMKQGNHVAGWMQNLRYNWEYVAQNGTPPPISNGKIYLENLSPGIYRVDWYNSSAQQDSTQQLVVEDNTLVLDAPPVVWDGMFEVSYLTTLDVAFSAAPLSGDVPLTVQFTDHTNAFGAGITSWYWNFGDGTTSGQQNPQHTYETPGTYSVVLKVTSGQYQETLQKNNLITVNQPLIADFSAEPLVVLPGDPVQFTDASVGNPLGWFWTFGDNTISYSRNPVHTYLQPGVYDISLLIQKSARTNLAIKNDYIEVLEPLIASFAADANLAAVGSEIHFTDQSQGDPEIWHWDFGNGTTSDLQHPSVAYSNPGTYSILLKVENPYQQDSIMIADYITILEPLQADFAADSSLLWVGQQAQFTDLSSGNPDSWLWDFGDSQTSAEQNPVHAFQQPGSYTVSLQIGDTLQNAFEEKTGYIRVRDTLQADFVADTTVIVKGQSLQFYDQSKGNVQSWFWLFGDGFFSQMQNPSHRFKSAGQFTVSLEVSSSDSSDVQVRENYIEVQPLLEAGFAADTLVAFSGDEIHFFDTSRGNPTGWYWSFGNFSNSIEQNPVVTFDAPGTYTIGLKVFTPLQQDSVEKQGYITILEPLQANFTADKYTFRIGEPVNLFDQSTGNPDTWEWWCGSGDTTHVQNPQITYYQEGLHDVTLIVQNEYAADTLCRNGFIYVEAPGFSQNVPLKKGWSGIASFVSPVFPDIESVLASVIGQVHFAVNEQGIFWPDLNINTLGNWDPAKGLTIDMKCDTTVLIRGYATIDDSLHLDPGWNVLPVLRPCDLNANEMLQILGNRFDLIKEIGGWKIFWPSMGIGSLESLEAGKTYMIYMNQETSLSLPACDNLP